MLLSPWEIIRKSWDLYRKNFSIFFPYLILILFPTIVLTLLGTAFVYLSTFISTPALAASNIIITLVVFVASLVFAIWVSIAFTKVIALRVTQADGQISEWKVFLSSSSHLITTAIIASLLTTLIVLVGSIFFIIPGIIFALWYAFSFCAIAIDEQKTMSALKMSKNLVVGRWFAVLWRVIVPGIFFALLGALVTQLFWEILSLLSLSKDAVEIVFGFISAIVNVLITPMAATAIVLVYLDLKEKPTVSQPPITENK